MEFTSPQIYLSVLALIYGCAMLTRSIYFHRKAARLAIELASAKDNLEFAETSLYELEQKKLSDQKFQQTLHDAELTTRLQQPLLNIRHGHEKVEAPERYQYLKSLAKSGMSASEIASVLSISSHEAEQLVNLARLADLSSSS